jgi:hypothetical protein
MNSSLQTHCDIFIWGATPAGIAAAVVAARAGASVVLANPHRRLGGMWSNGVQIFDTLYEGWRCPMLDEMHRRIADWTASRHGKDSREYRDCFYGDRLAPSARPAFSPQCGLEVLTAMVAQEAGITLVVPHEILSVSRRERLMESVTLRSLHDGTTGTFAARVFLDCSYEGDLFAAAGEAYRVGREGRKEFGEPHAGVIYAQRGGRGQHPREAAAGRLNLRTFQLTTTEIFAGSTGEADRAVQAYNSRLALCSEPGNTAPIPCPKNYDRSRYLGLLSDYTDRDDAAFPIKADLLEGGLERARLPERVGKLNYWNLGNFVGGNRDYPEADWSRRFRIIREHHEHVLGMLYFLQNDQDVPQEMRRINAKWGLPLDEYTDNSHLPSEIYVREARRLVGRHILTEHDYLIEPGRNRTPDYADSIAFTDWPMDSHDCVPRKKIGSLYDGVLLLTESTRPGTIPYRAILPQQTDNLLVPVCLSSTHVAWGALRLEPTWIHISESAAHAALMSIEKSLPPAALDVQSLQLRLLKHRIGLAFFNDSDLSDPTTTNKAIQFFGCRGLFDSYDAKPQLSLDGVSRDALDSCLRRLHANVPPAATVGETLARAFTELNHG